MEKTPPSSSGQTAQLSPLSLFSLAPFFPTPRPASFVPTHRPKQAALQAGLGRPRQRAAFPLLWPAPTLPSPTWAYSALAQRQKPASMPPHLCLSAGPASLSHGLVGPTCRGHPLPLVTEPDCPVDGVRLSTEYHR